MNIETASKIITLSTAALLLFGTQLGDDLLLFFLVGAIPGTNQNIPSWAMLAIITLGICYVSYLVARAYRIDRAVMNFANVAKHIIGRRNYSDAA